MLGGNASMRLCLTVLGALEHSVRQRLVSACNVLATDGARHARWSVMRTPADTKSGRRRFLAALGACAMARPVASSTQALTQAHGALTKEQRDRLTPAQVLDELKK